MRKSTFCVLLACYALGIVLAKYNLFPLPIHHFTGFSIYTLFTIGICISLWSARSIFIGVAALLFILIGGHSFTLHKRLIKEILSFETQEKVPLLATIDKSVKKTRSGFTASLQLHSLTAEVLLKANVFTADSCFAELQKGDTIRCSVPLSSIRSPANPYQFNYKDFAMGQAIYFQIFLKEDQWSLISAPIKSTQKRVEIYKKRCTDFLKHNITKKDAFGLVKAMILGDKSSLDPLIKDQFRDTGAIHVLAVSGLHVGIVLALLIFFLGLLPLPFRIKKWSVTLIPLVLIWCFAVLTGSSPSVIRACTMVSFFLCAKLLNKHGDIFYIVLLTGFFILVWDPNMLFNLSFQFSFLAILGIVLFMPILDELMQARSPVLRFFTASIKVSIAAQVPLFLLMIHYFNQFPLYFIPSSLLAIPLATIIIWLGVLSIFFSFIPMANMIAKLLLKGSEKTSELLLFCIDHLSQLPMTTWNELYLHSSSLIIGYAGILALILAYYLSNKKLLLAGGFCFIGLSINHNLNIANSHQELTTTIYHIKNKSLVEIYDKGVSYIINPDRLTNEEILKWTHKNNLAHYIKERHILPYSSSINQYPLNQSTLWIFEEPPENIWDLVQESDIVLIRNARQDQIPDKKKGTIILDGSSPFYIPNTYNTRQFAFIKKIDDCE